MGTIAGGFQNLIAILSRVEAAMITSFLILHRQLDVSSLNLVPRSLLYRGMRGSLRFSESSQFARFKRDEHGRAESEDKKRKEKKKKRQTHRSVTT